MRSKVMLAYNYCDLVGNISDRLVDRSFSRQAKKSQFSEHDFFLKKSCVSHHQWLVQPNVFSSFYRRFFRIVYFSPSLLHRRVKSWICLENLETCSRSPENIRLPCSALNHTRSLFPDFQIVSESEKTGVSTKRSSQIFEKNWKFRIFGFSDVWKQNLWPKTLDCLEHPKSCKILDFQKKSKHKFSRKTGTLYRVY